MKQDTYMQVHAEKRTSYQYNIQAMCNNKLIKILKW